MSHHYAFTPVLLLKSLQKIKQNWFRIGCNTPMFVMKVLQNVKILLKTVQKLNLTNKVSNLSNNHRFSSDLTSVFQNRCKSDQEVCSKLHYINTNGKNSNSRPYFVFVILKYTITAIFIKP